MRLTQQPVGPDMQVYRRFRWGDLAEFNVLDTRQYRSDQAYGDGTKPPGPESADPARTITGDAQEAWLLDGLAASRARWNVIPHQTAIMRIDTKAGPDVTVPMDTWDGYEASRRRILGGIHERGVENVVFLSGDLHRSLAADLLLDFDDPASPVVAAELVGTSITSGRDGEDNDEGGRTILAENPWIKYGNFQRGYVRGRFTRDEFRADYRVAPYVSRPGAELYTRTTLTVADGVPGLQGREEDGDEAQTRKLDPRARRPRAARHRGRRERPLGLGRRRWRQSGAATAVTAAIAPAALEVIPLPCFSATATLSLANPGTEAIYADAAVTAQSPLLTGRGAFSSWLPAGWTARAPVTVTAARDAAAGTYELRLDAGSARATVPVTVRAAPPKGPGDDLAYGEQAYASSTHGNFDVCGAVDGNTDSEQWDTATGWNDATRAVFPDSYGVQLAAPATVDRVTLRTIDSRKYPAARFGLRDWDVRVRVDGAWQTVASVRGNTLGVVESRFDPVVADRVEIVALAGNDATYSRLIELEVRGG